MNRTERPLAILFGIIFMVMLALIMISAVKLLQEKALNDELAAERENAYNASLLLERTYSGFLISINSYLRDTDDDNLHFAVCLAGAESDRLSWDMFSSILSACDRSIELDPLNAAYYDVRGLVNLRAGHPDEALKDFYFYLSWLEQNALYAEFGRERQLWVQRIEERNPQIRFTRDGMSYFAGDVIGGLQWFSNPLVSIKLGS